MHELSLMSEVIDTVTQTAQERNLTKIHKLKLVIGEYTSVMPESLLFAFDLLKKDPFIETSVLEIETRPSNEFYIDYFEGE
jgi:hydrogenase nickel incorporation protein HypA/HybF